MAQSFLQALDDKGSANAGSGGASKSEEAALQYCKYCGTQMSSNATVCQNCGRSQLTAQSKAEIEEQRRSESYIARNMRTIRVATFLICTGIFIGGLILGSQTPLSADDAEFIRSQVEQIIISGPTALAIAQNNIAICLIFFIPVFGVLFMVFVSYSTGLVISAYSLLSTSVTRLEILQATFLVPSTWLEVIAYSLAASEGTLFLLGVLTRRFKEEGKTLLKTILVCVALLIVGAVIESILVQA